MSNEEEIAAEYRAQLARRVAAEKARLAALAGDDEAAQAVRDAWQPIVDWQRDRGEMFGVGGC